MAPREPIITLQKQSPMGFDASYFASGSLVSMAKATSESIMLLKPKRLDSSHIDRNLQGFYKRINDQVKKTLGTISEKLTKIANDIHTIDQKTIDDLDLGIAEIYKVIGNLDKKVVPQQFVEELSQNIQTIYIISQLLFFSKAILCMSIEQYEQGINAFTEAAKSFKTSIMGHSGIKQIKAEIFCPSLVETLQDETFIRALGEDREILQQILGKFGFLRVDGSSSGVDGFISLIKKLKNFASTYLQLQHEKLEKDECSVEELVKIYQKMIEADILSSQELLQIADTLWIAKKKNHDSDIAKTQNKSLEKSMARAIEGSETQDLARIKLAAAYFDSKNYKQVMQLLGAKEHLTSEEAFVLCSAHYKLGNFDELREVFKSHSLQKFNNLSHEGRFLKTIFLYDIYINGNTEYQEQHYSELKKELSILVIDQEYVESYSLDGALITGIQHFRRKEYKEGVAAFRKAVRDTDSEEETEYLLVNQDSVAMGNMRYIVENIQEGAEDLEHLMNTSSKSGLNFLHFLKYDLGIEELENNSVYYQNCLNAIRNRDYDEMLYDIDHMGDINWRPKESGSTIFYAFASLLPKDLPDHYGLLLEKLISKGANPLICVGGNTVLHKALENGNLLLAKKSIEWHKAKFGKLDHKSEGMLIIDEETNCNDEFKTLIRDMIGCGYSAEQIYSDDDLIIDFLTGLTEAEGDI